MPSPKSRKTRTQTKPKSRNKALATTEPPVSKGIGAALAVVGGKASAAWNAVKALGPTAISLWPAGSKNILRYRRSKEAIGAWKGAVEQESDNYAEVERQLLERVPLASPTEIIEIEQKLDFITGRRRLLRTVGAAMSYIEEQPDPAAQRRSSMPKDASVSRGIADAESVPQQPVVPPSAISEHWLDHFSRLARVRNEPWRETLLARALAAEALNPGTVGPRVLWVIGTLDEVKFKMIAGILDICVWEQGRRAPFVPCAPYNITKIPPFPDDVRLGSVIYNLADEGVLADTEKASRRFLAGDHYVFTYGEKAVDIECKEALVVRGLLLTPLGNTLAQFHDPQPNDTGRDIFDAWIRGLDNAKYTVSIR